MTDRCLTTAHTATKPGEERKLETPLDSAFDISFLYSRDKREDSGKEEVRKPNSRRESGTEEWGVCTEVTMRSLHSGQSHMRVYGQATLLKGHNAQAVPHYVLKKCCNDLGPGREYGKGSQTKYWPSAIQRNPSLTPEVLLMSEDTGTSQEKASPGNG